MTRYTMRSRSQGALYMQRATSRLAERDEIVPVGLQGSNSRDAVKALVEATGLNPHLPVCGWPSCLDDVGGEDDMERGTI